MRIRDIDARPDPNFTQIIRLVRHDVKNRIGQEQLQVYMTRSQLHPSVILDVEVIHFLVTTYHYQMEQKMAFRNF